MAKWTRLKMSALDTGKIRKLYWKEGFTAKEIAKEFGVSIWSLYDFMGKNEIPRRSYSDANYLANKNKPQFNIKNNLNSSENILRIAGIMLYWAEGTQKGCTVDFANSNPNMIKLFMKFLRNICGVDEARLRVYLYGYSYQNINKLKKYWHKITGIPISQFTKPYVRKGTIDLKKRKLLYGLVHIRYNDKKLLNLLKGWIKAYIEECGEVPEWPNGPDCEERSVSKKFGMEKRVNSGEPLLLKS